jgi:hypothetical protein
VKGLARYPAFSRDSHYIYYIYVLFSHKSDAGIFRIPVKGGEVELVADLKDWHAGGDAVLDSILGWTSILAMPRCCCATLERKIFTPSLWTRNEPAIHCVPISMSNCTTCSSTLAISPGQ